MTKNIGGQGHLALQILPNKNEIEASIDYGKIKAHLQSNP
jgi:hypothetical protein